MLPWNIVSAQWPAHEILDLYVHSPAGVMGNTYILKDDNVISHRIVRDSFKNI